ncbi:MAG TPA: hypothetical protein VNZ25_03265 [Candidatus Angelobacter sp.]|nr:hypothetical protein [Candidatus Angelobacter sp.]
MKLVQTVQFPNMVAKAIDMMQLAWEGQFHTLTVRFNDGRVRLDFDATDLNSPFVRNDVLLISCGECVIIDNHKAMRRVAGNALQFERTDGG